MPSCPLRRRDTPESQSRRAEGQPNDESAVFWKQNGISSEFSGVFRFELRRRRFLMQPAPLYLATSSPSLLYGIFSPNCRRLWWRYKTKTTPGWPQVQTCSTASSASWWALGWREGRCKTVLLKSRPLQAARHIHHMYPLEMQHADGWWILEREGLAGRAVLLRTELSSGTVVTRLDRGGVCPPSSGLATVRCCGSKGEYISTCHKIQSSPALLNDGMSWWDAGNVGKWVM